MGLNYRALGEMFSLFRIQTEKIFSYSKVNERSSDDDFQIYFVPKRGIIIKKRGFEKFNETMSSHDYTTALRIPENIDFFERSKYYRKMVGEFLGSLEKKAEMLIQPIDDTDFYDQNSHRLKKIYLNFSKFDEERKLKVFYSYLKNYKSLEKISKKENSLRKKLGFKLRTTIR